jgi:16S rRNA (uracil1498-N3)-methyltransferase
MKKSEHQLFFSSDINKDRVVLDADEMHHARNVLRFGSGDLIFVTDGKGTIYSCRTNKQAPESTALVVVDKKQCSRQSPEISLFVGLPERDAFESLLDNITALEVSRIVPVICDYCQKSWWDESHWEKYLIRFNRILISAIKQSHNPFLPMMEKPIDFSAALDKIEGTCLVADQNGSGLSTRLETAGYFSTCSCYVGPPGGFSPEEMETLVRIGGIKVKVAEYRLRTELAATVLVGGLKIISMERR